MGLRSGWGIREQSRLTLNDILLRFTQKDRATTEGIEAGSTIQGGLMADTNDGTVGLGYPVSLSVNGGQHTYYESVADARGPSAPETLMNWQSEKKATA